VPDNALILLVEDQEEDILLIRRAFKKANFINTLQVVRDGEEAIAYLNGSGKYRNRDEYPLPALVLLDLKLPRLDGLEVLKWIRGQPGLSTLRVVVLTASQRIQDVNAAYQMGANSPASCGTSGDWLHRTQRKTEEKRRRAFRKKKTRA